MVTVGGGQVFDDDDPLPVTAAKGAHKEFVLSVSQTEFEALMDVLERIQQQMGQINNNNNLAPGERFI